MGRTNTGTGNKVRGKKFKRLSKLITNFCYELLMKNNHSGQLRIMKSPMRRWRPF